MALLFMGSTFVLILQVLLIFSAFGNQLNFLWRLRLFEIQTVSSLLFYIYGTITNVVKCFLSCSHIDVHTDVWEHLWS